MIEIISLILWYLWNLFLLCILYGFFCKIALHLLKGLAFPVYLGIHIMEFFTQNHFFVFDVPKQGNKKYLMHSLAMIVSIFCLILLSAWTQEILSNDEERIINFSVTAHPALAFPIFLNFILLGIIIWLGNVKGSKTKLTPLNKVENLSIPDLWKKFFQDIV